MLDPDCLGMTETKRKSFINADFAADLTFMLIVWKKNEKGRVTTHKKKVTGAKFRMIYLISGGYIISQSGSIL